MTGRRQGLRALAAELPRVTRAAFGRRGFAGARVIADWPEIVGPMLADISLPERLIRPRDGAAGVLVVLVRPAAALELQHWAPQVIERINSHYGFRAVAELRLRQGVVPPRRRHIRPPASKPSPEALAAIESRVAPIADPQLQDVLRRLGARLLASKG